MKRLFLLFTILLLVSALDYYRVLGVNRRASKKEIRRAYRELSLKYHPDKQDKFDKAMEDKWMQIQAAYEVLSDDDQRAIYDRHGEEGLKRHQQGNGRNGNPFSSPFDFFRGQHQHHQEEEKRVADLELPLRVSLQQLYTGASLKTTISRQIVCTQCHGTGAKSPSDFVKCSYCNGQGVRIIKQQLGPGFFTQSQMPCDKCGGKGTTIKKKCGKCKGKKIHRAQDTVEISIDAGMKDGDIITIYGYTDEDPDALTGDIRFEIHTIPDSIFERRGNDLYTKMKISLVEALAGFEKKIFALDGHSITVSQKDVTFSGQQLMVKGEGMPISGYGSGSGDLYVTVEVEFPKSIPNKADREALAKILSKYI